METMEALLYPRLVRTFVYRKSDFPEGMEFYTLITQGI